VCHSNEYVAVSRGLLTTKPTGNNATFSVQYWTTHPRFKVPNADTSAATVPDTPIINKTSNNSKAEVQIFSLPMQASVHCTELQFFNMQPACLHHKVMNAFQVTARLKFSPSRVVFGI
jgi:hypothetical protein